MATDSSRVILGLPSLPNDNLPTELYNELLVIYKAIRNAVEGVTRLTGVDPPDESEWAASYPINTILTGNTTRIYPVAFESIAAGQTISIMSDGGLPKVRLASANSAATMAHGIANTAAAPGQVLEMQWLRSFVYAIGGMTVGTLYYLSTTPGAIQNLPPVVAGTIQQPIGVAIGPSSLLMDISLSFKQN